MSVVCILACAQGRRYNTTSIRDEDRLNVHIVCHTHDDPGWLKTVDQYYWGSKNTIVTAGVQYILDTVLMELEANPDRTFTYAEMSFFRRWWNQQERETKDRVKKLVEDGRLVFVNGGHVQHDEATCHYQSMIDQTTLGHSFLKETFGVTPRVAWQLDPFGHSATQAALLTGEAGYEAIFFGRTDYQELAARRAQGHLEFLWRPHGEGEPVFAGAFASGNYGPPEGFGFEWGAEPIADDPAMGEFNVHERVEAFVQRAQELFASTKGRDVMLTMGSDFNFANAHLWYANLDRLIHYVNLDGRVNVLYSSPEMYADAKKNRKGDWTHRSGDLFPYADGPHAYWTGYFSSRPTSKRFIRQAGAALQAARQVEAAALLGRGLPPRPRDWSDSTAILEAAVALTQHHDAATGTEKQHVANDYHRRLHAGLAPALDAMGRTLASLKGGKGCPEPSRPGEEELERLAVASMRRRRMLQEVEGVGEEQTMVGEALYQEQFLEGEIQQTLAPLPALEWCQWLNISACSPSVSASQTAQGVDVVLYNPLPWLVRAPVRVPVRAGRDQEPWTVTGPHALCMQSQLVPVSSATLELQRLLRDARALDPLRDEAAEQELVFQADLPPLGYAAVSVKRGGGPTEDRGCLWDGVGATHAASEARSVSIPLSKADGDEETLENDRVSLVFSKSTGLLTRAAVDGLERELSARLAWYNSSDGLESKRGRGQASGAYVFRPNGRFELPADGARVELELVRGPVVQEARQRFADWAHLTTRIYAHSAEVEVEWSVGPIPDEDGLGKEVVVEYSSNLDNGAEFWTDSNGHRMMRRVRDEFEPWTLDLTEQVARNYYPAAAAALIRDEAAELAVIVDRAQGASGQRPGALELMLHRRILRDDDRGVEEALNETACACTEPCPCVGLPARGFHRVLLQAPGPEAAKQRRLAQQRGLDAPLLFFAARSEKPAERDCRAWSALSKRQTPLPEGVHVLTLDGRADDRLLLRLVNVLEPPGQALAVDLGAWVEGARWARVRELSLTANRDLSAGEGGRLARGAFGGCNGDCADVDLKIELEPLQIRTFEMYPEAR